MSMAVSIGSDSISVYKDGQYYIVDKSHPNYTALLQELRKQPRDEEAVLGLADVPRFVSRISSGRVEIREDEILFSGQPVSGYMVDRLLAMATAGDDVTSWATFMDNLMDNPLPGVREDLYKWMEAGRMPITPDGCIIAFKKVRENYSDVHTGKFSNAVGSVLEMDRSLCDTNRNNTCSSGFHFCSAGYLREFPGEKVVVVKINPRDVTAIPRDYNNNKGRCCKYVVTGELKEESAARHRVWSQKNVVDLADPRELPEVMLPRKGAKLSEVPHDPARTDGPPPVDDLAGDPAALPPLPAADSAQPAPAQLDAATPAPAPQASPPPRTDPAAGTFVSKGVTFTAQQIKDAYEAAGRVTAKTAAALDVPKTTMLGWLRKIL